MKIHLKNLGNVELDSLQQGICKAYDEEKSTYYQGVLAMCLALIEHIQGSKKK
jgi:hypothetical protein